MDPKSYVKSPFMKNNQNGQKNTQKKENSERGNRNGSSERRRRRVYQTPSRSTFSHIKTPPTDGSMSSSGKTPMSALTKENVSPKNSEHTTPETFGRGESKYHGVRPKTTPSKELRAMQSPVVRAGTYVDSTALTFIRQASQVPMDKETVASTPAPAVVSPEKILNTPKKSKSPNPSPAKKENIPVATPPKLAAAAADDHAFTSPSKSNNILSQKLVSPSKIKATIRNSPGKQAAAKNISKLSPFHLHDDSSKIQPVRAKVAAELNSLLVKKGQHTPSKRGKQALPQASPFKLMKSSPEKTKFPVSPPRPAVPATADAPFLTNEQATRRTLVSNEILSSESTYVNSIEAIIQVYANPLQQAAQEEDTTIISTSLIDKIFNNIQVLCTFNSYFLQNLKDRMEDWDAARTKIGDLFLQFAPFFKMYSQYVANFEEVPHILKDILEGKGKNLKFNRFCQTAQTQPHCQVGLLSLLVMPIQRIPRYRMLLEALLKETPEQHLDKASLQEALELVSKVAESINQDIRLQQNRNRIRTLEEEFVGGVSFAGPSRLYVRQGKLCKKSTNGDRDFEFFLFDDLLGYASYVRESASAQKKYKLVQTIDIRDLTSVQAVTTESEEAPAGASTKKSGEDDFSFVLIGSRESFVVACGNPEEGKLWIRDINYYINRASKINSIHKQRRMRESNSSRQVIWRADNSATHCPYCDAAFTLFVRRHHCRQCGNLTCAACSATKMTVFGSVTPQRVCDACSPWGRQMADPSEKEVQDRQLRLTSDAWGSNLASIAETEERGDKKEEASSNGQGPSSQGMGAKARDLHKSALGYKWYGQLLHLTENANWAAVPNQESGKPMEWTVEYPSSSTRQAFKAVALVKADPAAVCAFLYNTHFEGSTQKIIKSFKRSMLLYATVTSRYLWSAAKRDFAIVKDWRKLDNGTYCVLSRSVNSSLIPPVAGLTRGVIFHNGWLIKPIVSQHFRWSEVTYVADLDPRGWVPNWMKTKIRTDQLTALRSLQFQGKFIADSYSEGRFPLDGIHNSQVQISSRVRSTISAANESLEAQHMNFLKVCGVDPAQILSDENTSDAKNPEKLKVFEGLEEAKISDIAAFVDTKTEEQGGETQDAQESTSVESKSSFMKEIDSVVAENDVEEIEVAQKNASTVAISASRENLSSPHGPKSDLVRALREKIQELEHENLRMKEQVLQVKDYLKENQDGQLQNRMEEQLSKANLELCETKAENETLLFKLEKMQDKMVALRKQKKCPRCTSSLAAGGGGDGGGGGGAKGSRAGGARNVFPLKQAQKDYEEEEGVK